MKRITGARVVNAYKATGIKPVQGKCFSASSGEDCGCALTALAAHEKDAPRCEFDQETDQKLGTAAIDRLGLLKGYKAGFMNGWDDTFPNRGHFSRATYIAGYEDGVKARVAVIKSGLAEFSM